MNGYKSNNNIIEIRSEAELFNKKKYVEEINIDNIKIFNQADLKESLKRFPKIYKRSNNINNKT